MGELEIISQGYTEIELNGKTRKIGKLTVGDFADFEQYVQEQRKQKILSTARELYPDAIPDSVLDKALAPASDKELEEQQGSIIGIRFLLWRALKKFSPDMTIEEAGEMITLDDIEVVTAAIMPVEKKTKPKVKARSRPVRR